jgi:hypothetical protein
MCAPKVSIALTTRSLANRGMQYSPVVIERMRARNHNRPEMQCISVSPVIFTNQNFERATVPGLVMDIRDLRFEGNSFDVAIDKGKAAFEPG